MIEGTRADVYWNFHDKTWSIKSMESGSDDYGNVIGHADRVLVDDPEFVVQPSGLRRFRNTGKRNLHAFVRGEVAGTGDDATVGDYRTWEFFYCPRDDRYRHLDVPFVFYDVPLGVPVSNTDPEKVLLTLDHNYGLFDYTVDL